MVCLCPLRSIDPYPVMLDEGETIVAGCTSSEYK